MENMKTKESKKQLKNLSGKLTKDSNNLFYSVEKINRSLINKAWKSVYEKGKVFYKFYNEIENCDTIFDEEDKKISFLCAVYWAEKGHWSIVNPLQYQNIIWVLSCRYSEY